MQRINSHLVLLLTYSTMWQTATVCTNGTFGFESFIGKKKWRFSQCGEGFRFCAAQTTQHPTNINFKKRERFADLDCLEVISGLKPGLRAWSVVRGLRTRRRECGISVLWLYRCKKFRAFWHFICSSGASLWGQRDVHLCDQHSKCSLSRSLQKEIKISFRSEFPIKTNAERKQVQMNLSELLQMTL